MKESGSNATIAIVLALTIALLIWSFGCGESDPIKKEIKILKNYTLPPNSKLIYANEIVRKDQSLSTLWELEAQQPWDEYIRWVTKNLDGEYKLISSSDTEASFKRILTGDIYKVWVENISTKLPLRVRVGFEAYPF